MNDIIIDSPNMAEPAAPIKAWHRLEWADPRRPAGPDGKGWNRLSIFPMTPAARCELQPQTRPAALDTLRGMASVGNLAAYDPCLHQAGCDSCPVATAKRDRWHADYCVREDLGGRVWLIGSVQLGFAGFGYSFRDWKALMAAYEVPQLQRERDETGFYWIQTESPASRAEQAA